MGKFRGRTRDMHTIRRGAGANNGGNDGPEVTVSYGGKSKTNGRHTRRTRSPGLDEATADQRLSQGHGGEMVESDPARVD